MPKTRNAFAFRCLYPIWKQFPPRSMERLNSFEEYEKFLSRGFDAQHAGGNDNTDLNKLRKNTMLTLYICFRAYRTTRRINHHIHRLVKLRGKIQNSRLDELITKYQQLHAGFMTLETDYESESKIHRALLKQAFAEIFGMRLRQARKKAGIKQVELAARLGIEQNSYSRFELGQREPPLYQINELAEILGVTVDYLFDRC